MSDSGYDTVRTHHYRNVENLSIHDRPPPEPRRDRPASADLTRDKVYQTFVRPVLNNVSAEPGEKDLLLTHCARRLPDKPDLVK